jgi:hypothetical protein
MKIRRRHLYSSLLSHPKNIHLKITALLVVTPLVRSDSEVSEEHSASISASLACRLFWTFLVIWRPSSGSTSKSSTNPARGRWHEDLLFWTATCLAYSSILKMEAICRTSFELRGITIQKTALGINIVVLKFFWFGSYVVYTGLRSSPKLPKLLLAICAITTSDIFRE